jgi:ribonuclease HI
MNASAPHFLLLSESSKAQEPGRWRFVLRTTDGSQRLVADDVEPDVRGERLELLTVVRGLEALDQPSRVTIVTPSLYVRKGIEYGISEWRQTGWRWEFYGEMVPIRDSDLWQRLDRAMQFHQLRCRTIRFDPPHQPVRPPSKAGAGPAQLSQHGSQECAERAASVPPRLQEHWQRFWTACQRLIQEIAEQWRIRLGGIPAAVVPCVRVD